MYCLDANAGNDWRYDEYETGLNLTLLAAPEGIKHFCEIHPDVPLYTAAIDEHLDEHGYIIPGLGDVSDRSFGTK